MSSNNTPPATTTETAPAPVTLSPDVTINGRTFDLTKIDVKTGAELAAALPQEYQARIAQRAKFFQNYRLELANLPAELLKPGGVEQLMAAIKKGGGQLAADAPAWMQQSVTAFTQNGVVSSAKGVYDFFQTVHDSGQQFTDGLTWSVRAISGLMGAAGDAASSYGKISPQQATAMAATYEAALYKLNQVPEAGLLDKATAGVETALSWVIHTIHNIWPQAAVTLMSLKNYVAGGFQDWSSSYAAAESTLKQEGAAQSYQTILQRDMVAKTESQSGHDASVLRSQIGSVAGVNVGAMFATADKTDAIIVGQDRLVYGAHKGVLDNQPLTDANNKPIGQGALNNSRLNYVRGSLLTNPDPVSLPNIAGLAGAALGTSGAIAAVGVLPGGARAIKDSFQLAPLKRMEAALEHRHEKIIDAAKGVNAGARTWDPRTWFSPNAEKATARAGYFEAIAAKEEASALQRGVTPQAIQAAKEALVQKVTPAAEKAVAEAASHPSFWSNPIRSMIHGAGGLIGKAGDGIARTVGGSISHAQRVAGEALGLVTKPVAAFGEATGLAKPFAGMWAGTKSVFGFGLRRAPEIGMVLGAIDDTGDGINSAANGDSVGATRAAGRVVGGVGGTLAGGAASTSILGWLGLSGAATTTAAAATTTAVVATEAAATAGLAATAAAGAVAGAEAGAVAGGVGTAPAGGIGAIPGVIIGGLIGVTVATAGYFIGRKVVGSAAESAATLVTGHGPRITDPGLSAATAESTQRAQQAARLAMTNPSSTGLGAVTDGVTAGNTPPVLQGGAKRIVTQPAVA